MTDLTTDVVVIGAGNAACCAALAAAEKGANVIMLERAPAELRGGNTAFTAGAMRVVYNGIDDIESLIPDLSAAEKASTDFGSYTQAEFLDDLARVTEYQCDPDLAETLVSKSLDTLKWMRDKGVRFAPIYGRQAFKVDGRFKFWGGLTVEAVGGGPGLIEALYEAVRKAGIKVLYSADAYSLLRDDAGVCAVCARIQGKKFTIKARAIVLACGGFQANPEWRTRYLGAGWETAKVRGTPFNTGDGIRMAIDIGAATRGNWSGCHAVGWERNAPEFGDLAVGDGFQKHSYPFGIMVNADGERFVDEGADFRNYTYAKYGREILAQPGQFAWQVFDQKVSHLLRDEYRIKQVTKVVANSLEELSAKLDDVDGTQMQKTIRQYNRAIEQSIAFNPNVKDGRKTDGLAVNKSNWANLIDTPPFEAYAVTCGITFTFGGLRINPHGQVLGSDLNPIAGLYAAGEIVGGIFYFNYPGGSGLTNGAVFGRIAGAGAGLDATTLS
ncbi:MAG: tricarballylate dehydrogenase [Gammaproteobacteria bacterium]|jgi:tricarballylate dehydrogenase